MRRSGTFTAFFLICGLAAPIVAVAAEPPAVDRFRAYLIYEDSGELSKNRAKDVDQIIANDDKGTSVQMLVDVVMTAKANSLHESNPFLYVVVHSTLEEPSAKPLVDIGFPLTFVGNTGELVRTLVVDHNCNGFDIEAYVMDGDKRTSEIRKSFSITCGD